MKYLLLIATFVSTITSQAEIVSMDQVYIIPGISSSSSSGTFIKGVKIALDSYRSSNNQEYFIPANTENLKAICKLIGKRKVTRFESSYFNNVPLAYAQRNNINFVKNGSANVVTSISCSK